jgi:hypothetical protein
MKVLISIGIGLCIGCSPLGRNEIVKLIVMGVTGG